MQLPTSQSEYIWSQKSTGNCYSFCLGTCNFTIGDINSLCDHAIWRLSTLFSDATEKIVIMWIILSLLNIWKHNICDAMAKIPIGKCQKVIENYVPQMDWVLQAVCVVVI